MPGSEGRALSAIVPQPKPTKGRMRIHCLENVDKALQFLKEKQVHLENMGSHDIVDGNHRLILGLIWTIILRFQVPRAGGTHRLSAPAGAVLHHPGLSICPAGARRHRGYGGGYRDTLAQGSAAALVSNEDERVGGGGVSGLGAQGCAEGDGDTLLSSP